MEAICAGVPRHYDHHFSMIVTAILIFHQRIVNLHPISGALKDHLIDRAEVDTIDLLPVVCSDPSYQISVRACGSDTELSILLNVNLDTEQPG